MQLAFGCAATVGLKSPAVGKVFIAVVPQLSATPDLASAGCSEIFFAHVHPTNTAASNGRRIGQIEKDVEVPDALEDDQLRFLRNAVVEQVALMLASGERNLDAPIKREQGEYVALNRVGAFVEVDGRLIELDYGNWLVLGDAVVGLERFVGVGHAVNRLANHLATQRREQCSNRVIGKVVQGNAIPAAVLNGARSYGVTRLRKCFRQNRQCRRMIRACQKLHGYGTFHIGHFKPTETAMQPQNRLITSSAFRPIFHGATMSIKHCDMMMNKSLAK